MKGKRNTWLFLGGIAAALIIIVYLISSSESARDDKSYKKSRPVNWNKNYSAEKKSPYGAYIFYQLVNKFFYDQGKNQLTPAELKNEKKDFPDKKFLLIKIADELELGYREAEEIFTFVKNGNSVFIAANSFSKEIESLLSKHLWISNPFYKSSSHYFTVESLEPEKKYPLTYYHDKGVSSTIWTAFNWKEKEDANDRFSWPVEGDRIGNPLTLCLNDRKEIVYTRIPYENGYFYIHTTPLAFSNLSLLQEKNVEYLEKVLSCLPESDFLWEQISPEQKPPVPPDHSLRRKESPLMFILSQPSLKWAYYLLLVTLLIFVLFRMKRRQRVIPGMKKHGNSAVEFADTLSKLYFEQGRHNKLVKHKEKLLYHFIRKRYFIYSRSNDPRFIPLLSVKSAISEEQLNKLFLLYEQAGKQEEITDEQLLEIHSLTEYFYKNCK